MVDQEDTGGARAQDQLDVGSGLVDVANMSRCPLMQLMVSWTLYRRLFGAIGKRMLVLLCPDMHRCYVRHFQCCRELMRLPNRQSRCVRLVTLLSDEIGCLLLLENCLHECVISEL